jgi:8-oxo-dGTP diphosphatase
VARWFTLDKLLPLAFDHKHIYTRALDALRAAARLRSIIFELLPSKFTLTDVQILYEQIFDVALDKRNFRKKIHTLGYIKESQHTTKGRKH